MICEIKLTASPRKFKSGCSLSEPISQAFCRQKAGAPKEIRLLHIEFTAPRFCNLFLYLIRKFETVPLLLINPFQHQS